MEGEKDAAAAKAIVVEEEDGEEAVYSVWAVPPEDVRERLRKLMQNLRAEFGGPEFEPHVTVVGAMRLTKRNAIQKLQSACAGLKPYTVRIVSVSRGNFFYQCVYLLLHPTPEVKIEDTGSIPTGWTAQSTGEFCLTSCLFKWLNEKGFTLLQNGNNQIIESEWNAFKSGDLGSL